jgi:hypothetical protein
MQVEATAVRAERDALAVDLKTAKDALDFYSAARQDHELLESALSRADMRDSLANRCPPLHMGPHLSPSRPLSIPI